MMYVRRFLPLALVFLAAQFFSACSFGFNAPGKLIWYLDNRESVWRTVNKGDFRVVDLKQAEPTSDGSNLLLVAIHYSGGVDRTVSEEGIPDGVRVVFTGNAQDLTSATRFELAYLERGAVLMVEPRHHSKRPGGRIKENPLAADVRPNRSRKPLDDPAADALRPWYVERELEEGERVEIEPELAVRKQIEQWARVFEVGRELLLRVEPGDFVHKSPYADRHGYLGGFVTAPVTDASTRVFGDAGAARGRYVAWVDPKGPADGVLEVGWRILTVDDTPIELFEWSHDGEPLEILLRRGAESRMVTLTPEPIPVEVSLGVWSTSHTAFASLGDSGAHIGISAQFLDLLTSEDALAYVLGHEIGHIVLAREKPRPDTKRSASLEYERDQERAADLFGVRLAHRAGYDPFGGVLALDAIEERRGDMAVVSFQDTHPPYRQRRETIYAEAQRLRDGGSETLD